MINTTSTTATSLFRACYSLSVSVNKNNNTEEFCWLVNAIRWELLSSLVLKDAKQPLATIYFFANVKGRIFLYLMGPQTNDGNKGGITLTLSNTALEPISIFPSITCGLDNDKDPEDPGCARNSHQGGHRPMRDQGGLYRGEEFVV